MNPYTTSEQRQQDAAATRRAEHEAFLEHHPEFSADRRLPRLINTIVNASAKHAVEMSNTLVRSELEARARRFTGESLPGFGRPQ